MRYQWSHSATIVNALKLNAFQTLLHTPTDRTSFTMKFLDFKAICVHVGPRGEGDAAHATAIRVVKGLTSAAIR